MTQTPINPWDAENLADLIEISPYDTSEPCTVCDAAPETPCVYTSDPGEGDPEKGSPRPEPHHYGGRKPFDLDGPTLQAVIQGAKREALRQAGDARMAEAMQVSEWLYSMANSGNPLPPRASLSGRAPVLVCKCGHTKDQHSNAREEDFGCNVEGCYVGGNCSGWDPA